MINLINLLGNWLFIILLNSLWLKDKWIGLYICVFVFFFYWKDKLSNNGFCICMKGRNGFFLWNGGKVLNILNRYFVFNILKYFGLIILFLKINLIKWKVFNVKCCIISKNMIYKYMKKVYFFKWFLDNLYFLI